MHMNPLKTLHLINRIDRDIDIIYRTGRIRIERTKTSKEALKIEAQYLPKIKKLFKQIVREYEGRLHFIYEAEKRYGDEIRTIIKSMVTKAYFLGIEYISRSVKNPHHIFLSPNDVTQILLKSDDAYRMFWRLITKHLQVKKNRTRINKTAAITHHDRKKPKTNVTLTDEIFGVMDDEDNRLLDEDTSAALITSGIVTTTIALVTLEKYREYKQDQLQQERQQILFEDFEEDDAFTDTFPLDELQEGSSGDTVVFATENDAKVCPDCAELEGEEWEIGDPSIIFPVEGTHPNCRCRLLLKIDGNIMAK